MVKMCLSFLISHKSSLKHLVSVLDITSASASAHIKGKNNTAFRYRWQNCKKITFSENEKASLQHLKMFVFEIQFWEKIQNIKSTRITTELLVKTLRCWFYVSVLMQKKDKAFNLWQGYALTRFPQVNKSGNTANVSAHSYVFSLQLGTWLNTLQHLPSVQPPREDISWTLISDYSHKLQQDEQGLVSPPVTFTWQEHGMIAPQVLSSFLLTVAHLGIWRRCSVSVFFY